MFARLTHYDNGNEFSNCIQTREQAVKFLKKNGCAVSNNEIEKLSDKDLRIQLSYWDGI
jgi:hypothetical protein